MSVFFSLAWDRMLGGPWEVLDLIEWHFCYDNMITW